MVQKIKCKSVESYVYAHKRIGVLVHAHHHQVLELVQKREQIRTAQLFLVHDLFCIHQPVIVLE